MHTRALAATALLATTAHAHPFNFRTGVNGNGELSIWFEWDLTHTEFAFDPAFDGVIDQELAFEDWLGNSPQGDLYPAPTGLFLELVVVSFDPGVYLRAPSKPFVTFVHDPADTFALGTTGSGYFTQTLWHIDPTAPGFQPAGPAGDGLWNATFFIRDRDNTAFRSQDYTFILEPEAVPAPAAAAALGVAGLAAARRRRA